MKMRLSINKVLLVMLIVVAGIAGYRHFYPADASIAAAGGAPLIVTNFPPAPYYLQKDPAWAGDTVGGSGESLAAVGCAVCSLSMAFTQCGAPITPGALKARLKAGNGYTRQGWLVWGAAVVAVDPRLAVEVPGRPTHARLDAALQQGQPVVTKILLHGRVPHWVLIVGKAGDQYLVKKNPLDGRRRIQKLSSLAPRMEAIRIVRGPRSAAATTPG